MTMRLTQLRTYWEANEASAIIDFLDELKDVLWTVYGDEIIEQRQALQQESDSHNDQLSEGDINIF